VGRAQGGKRQRSSRATLWDGVRGLCLHDARSSTALEGARDRPLKAGGVFSGKAAMAVPRSRKSGDGNGRECFLLDAAAAGGVRQRLTLELGGPGVGVRDGRRDLTRGVAAWSCVEVGDARKCGSPQLVVEICFALDRLADAARAPAKASVPAASGRAACLASP
jgi:hypothetical protein